MDVEILKPVMNAQRSAKKETKKVSWRSSHSFLIHNSLLYISLHVIGLLKFQNMVANVDFNRQFPPQMCILLRESNYSFLEKLK